MKRALFPFPPIENTAPKRLPRGLSPLHSLHTKKEPCGGRVLIALRRVNYKTCFGRIWVRNCYERTGAGIYVENMREFARVRTVLKRAVHLRRLTRSHFVIYKPPFMVSEPVVDCLAEMEQKDFDNLWETHRLNKPTCVQAYTAPPDTTPMFRLLDAHWKAHGLKDGWSAQRVIRLSRMWNLTLHELAEMIQWPIGDMDHYVANASTFHPLPGPVAVWFTFLENFRLGIPTFPVVESPKSAAA